MPDWMMRVATWMSFIAGAMMIAVAVVEWSFDLLPYAGAAFLLSVVIVLLRRQRESTPVAAPNPRHRLLAIASAVAALGAALLTPWRLDTPWMPVGLFATLWLASMAVGYGATYARARSNAG